MPIVAIGHAGVAHERDQQARGQRRCEDVHGVVAEQDGADQTLAVAGEPLDRARTPVALAGEMVHARAGGRGQRGLGAGEEAR